MRAQGGGGRCDTHRVFFDEVLERFARARQRGADAIVADRSGDGGGEPTASLDLRHQLDLVAAVRRRAEQGTTVITVVHDLNLAALMADRVIVLGDGRIAADGAPGASINDEVVQRVFGIASAVNMLPKASLPFVLPHHARRLG